MCNDVALNLHVGLPDFAEEFEIQLSPVKFRIFVQKSISFQSSCICMCENVQN